MRKTMFIILIVLLIISAIVNADPFATLAMTGLSFVNPTAYTIVNGIMCVTGPAGLVTCAAEYAQGKIIGQVKNEVLTKIAESGVVGEQAVKAITTYNQVKSYIDQGAEIIQELKLDEKGIPQEGKIKIARGGYIGKLLGFKDYRGNFRNDYAYGDNIEIQFNGANREVNTIIFREGKEGKFSVINYKDEKYDYVDIEQGLIDIDEDGKVLFASFIAGKKGGNYFFNDKQKSYLLFPGQRIVYDNGIITIQKEGNSRSDFSYLEYEIDKNGNNRLLKESLIDIKEGDIKINGPLLSGKKFSINENIEVEGEITFIGGRVRGLRDYTKASILGVEIDTIYPLSLYYEKNFDKSLHINENYFNYGEGKISAGGDYFIFVLKEGNQIFPEYREINRIDSETVKRNILGFEPRGGHLEITKNSKDGDPLILDVKIKGKSTIRNGAVVLYPENNDLYTFKNNIYDLTYDMNIRYNEDEYILKESTLNIKNIKIDYETHYDKIIQKKLSDNPERIKELKEALEKKYGVKPRNFFGTINDQREEKFLKFLFKAAETASQNKFGVSVSPEEVLTNFMLEGGVKLFEDMRIRELEIIDIIPPGSSTINYMGKNYEIRLSKFSDYPPSSPYIVVDGEAVYTIPVNRLEREGNFIKIKDKKYELKKEQDYEYIIGDLISRYYQDHNTPVDGFAHMGTDVAGDPKEQKRLLDGGFWPKNLKIINPHKVRQEQGSETITADFETLEDGLTAMSGILAERKKAFFDDFKNKFGDEELKRLSQEEISFWTYLYYNCGSGCGKGNLYGTNYVSGGKKIKGAGREHSFKKLEYPEPSCTACMNARVNALRRLATQLWLEKSGIFDVKPSKDIIVSSNL